VARSAWDAAGGGCCCWVFGFRLHRAIGANLSGTHSRTLSMRSSPSSSSSSSWTLSRLSSEPPRSEPNSSSPSPNASPASLIVAFAGRSDGQIRPGAKMHLKSRVVVTREPQRWILRADDAAVGAPWRRLSGSSSYPFGARRMEGNARVGNALWGERPLPSRRPDPPASPGRPNGPLHPPLFRARRKMPPPPDERRVPAVPAPARARANHRTDRDPARPKSATKQRVGDGHVGRVLRPHMRPPAAVARPCRVPRVHHVAVDVHGRAPRHRGSRGGG